MAALSPRKLRTDFTDFLRAGHNHSQLPQQPAMAGSDGNNGPSAASTSALQMDSLHVPDTPGRSRTRLPFLGRASRKKSTVRAEPASDVDQPDTPSPTYTLDERVSVASDPSISQQARSVPNPPITNNSHHSFLSRFTPKSSRKASRHGPDSGYTSDQANGDPRSPSREPAPPDRSITPRPSQPTITVDGVSSDYVDLFTRLRMYGGEPNTLGTYSPRSSLASSKSSQYPPFASEDVTPTATKRYSHKFIADDPHSVKPEEHRSSIREKHKSQSHAHDRKSSLPSGKSGSSPRSHEPPSVPLPATPPSPPKRQRAQTLSSLSSRSSRSSAVLLPATPSPTSPRRPRSIHSDGNPSVDKETDNAEIKTDIASPDQLRHALHSRDQRVEELTAYITRLATNHAAEKLAFERKLALMEREVERRDKEIQGLTWLLHNGKSSSPSSPIVDMASKSTPSLELKDHDLTPSRPASVSVKSPALRRLNSDYGDESTADSSGNESTSSMRTTRGKRATKLLTKDASKRSSLRHSPLPEPDRPLPMVPVLDKRASLSSLPSSAASSVSSLPLPSTPSLTTLSVIPEGVPPVPKLPKRLSSSLRDPALVAAMTTRREGGDRRLASSIKSSPQKAAPAPTPAAAYAANLKIGASPSIAKMLDSPTSPFPASS